MRWYVKPFYVNGGNLTEDYFILDGRLSLGSAIAQAGIQIRDRNRSKSFDTDLLLLTGFQIMRGDGWLSIEPNTTRVYTLKQLI